MAAKQSKTGLIVTIIALALTLLVVGGIVVAQKIGTSKDNEQATQTETDQDKTTNAATDTPAQTTDQPSTQAPTVDPATLASIDIAPMSISVFYTKGIPGFEFAVKRTADMTDYVEFSSPQLVGTKCTDDAGAFASIIENPSSPEDQTTISLTTKVGETTYGLSLAGASCTADEALLKEYQTAFTNGFSSLKAL